MSAIKILKRVLIVMSLGIMILTGSALTLTVGSVIGIWNEQKNDSNLLASYQETVSDATDNTVNNGNNENRSSSDANMKVPNKTVNKASDSLKIILTYNKKTLKNGKWKKNATSKCDATQTKKHNDTGNIAYRTLYQEKWVKKAIKYDLESKVISTHIISSWYSEDPFDGRNKPTIALRATVSRNVNDISPSKSTANDNREFDDTYIVHMTENNGRIYSIQRISNETSATS